jgi:cobalt-zinc-cadmium efflux system outer membrane protein
LREARLRLRAELSLAHERLSTTVDEAQHLTNDVLPEAERAFEQTQRSYAARRLPLLALMDARRTFYRARAELVDDLEAYHLAVTEVERLVDVKVEPAH